LHLPLQRDDFMPTPKTNQSRRQFVKATAAAGAAIAGAPYFVPAHLLAGSKRGSANERIRVGSIGTSIYKNRYTGDGDYPGRGAVVGHQAGKLGDMIAVADVNRLNAEFFAKEYNGNCQVYSDYQELIARDDIDAVTIGTPDHWHAKIAIDALRAGKHVYCEKPLSLTIREGQQICKVAKETGKVFQTGTQQRTHHGDIAMWAMGMSNSGPTSIQGTGSYSKEPNCFNSAVEFDCDFEFPGGHTAKLLSGKNELIIGGKKGRIRVNRGGLTGKPAEQLGVSHKIGQDEWGTGDAPADAVRGGDGPQWMQDAIDKLYHGKRPGNHMGNFFECMADGGTPVSDVNSQHRSASLCHLANIAMQLGRKVKWDPQSETFPGDEANSMITREQRDGFKIDVEI